jgi:hypothetical protein
LHRIRRQIENQWKFDSDGIGFNRVVIGWTASRPIGADSIDKNLSREITVILAAVSRYQ